MSSPRIEVRIGGGEWFEVNGMVLPLAGARFRVLITDGWRALRAANPEDIQLRLDGALAIEVLWNSRPDGFATCEVVLGPARMRVAGTVQKAPEPSPATARRAHVRGRT